MTEINIKSIGIFLFYFDHLKPMKHSFVYFSAKLIKKNTEESFHLWKSLFISWDKSIDLSKKHSWQGCMRLFSQHSWPCCSPHSDLSKRHRKEGWMMLTCIILPLDFLSYCLWTLFSWLSLRCSRSSASLYWYLIDLEGSLTEGCWEETHLLNILVFYCLPDLDYQDCWYLHYLDDSSRS